MSLDDNTVLFPNQCLLNQYFSGKGISPHRDGELYRPCAAVISLLSPALLRFYRRLETSEMVSAGSVFLEPRSLLVFRDAAYTDLYHGIEDSEVDVCGDDVLNLSATSRQPGETVSRYVADGWGDRQSSTDLFPFPFSISPFSNFISRNKIRLSLTLRQVSAVSRQVGIGWEF